MTTRQEIIDLLSELLPPRAVAEGTHRLDLATDLRMVLGMTDEAIGALGPPVNRRFLVSLQTAELVDARTVGDLVETIYQATRRAVARASSSPPKKAEPWADAFEIRDMTTSAKVRAGYVVWYGTNRKRSSAEGAPLAYSEERGDVTWGRCQMFVPESHKMGSIGSPWWRRLVIGDDRVRLLDAVALKEDDYWTAIQAHLAAVGADDRTAVVFIHGYNVSFEGAARRAAQIGFDLSVRGAMAFFSWPSQGQLSGYLPDGAAIEASEVAIADFLVGFATRTGAKSVHVIAHSMGNRGLLRAVNRIVSVAGASGAAMFKQIVLAAPDVDAGVFRSLCSAYGSVGHRTTLYVSDKDLAVETSTWVHDFARAGFSPPVFIAPGIDTVNVTNVDVSRLGHGYVAEARDVLMDIYRLFADDAEPSRRNLAELADGSGSKYWEFRK
jgi:esterase/lipase superfamily enzyme